VRLPVGVVVVLIGIKVANRDRKRGGDAPRESRRRCLRAGRSAPAPHRARAESVFRAGSRWPGTHSFTRYPARRAHHRVSAMPGVARRRRRESSACGRSRPTLSTLENHPCGGANPSPSRPDFAIRLLRRARRHGVLGFETPQGERAGVRPIRSTTDELPHDREREDRMMTKTS